VTGSRCRRCRGPFVKRAGTWAQDEIVEKVLRQVLLWESVKDRVTHNMALARRASDGCAFMLIGRLIEHSRTDQMFVTPKQQQTADYIEGRYG